MSNEVQTPGNKSYKKEDAACNSKVSKEWTLFLKEE